MDPLWVHKRHCLPMQPQGAPAWHAAQVLLTYRAAPLTRALIAADCAHLLCAVRMRGFLIEA